MHELLGPSLTTALRGDSMALGSAQGLRACAALRAGGLALASAQGLRACAALSLHVRTRAQALALFDGLTALARGTAAIELSLAMVVAWLKRQDPADLGHLTFAAFCRERVDWNASWRRALVNLVEGPLDLVKRAACEGLIPLRLAVRANVAPAEQAEWLATATLGDAKFGDVTVGDATFGDVTFGDERPQPRWLESFDGEDADVIRRARRLGRLCLGRAATAREVDDYLLRCWRDRLPAEAILAQAYAHPQPPEPDAPLSWDWCRAWSEPASIEEALGRLDELQAILRGRTCVLALAWARIAWEALWTEAFESPDACAKAVLGLSLRQAQRLGRLGWTLEWYPELDAAVRAGLAPRHATALGGVLGENNVDSWLEIAARVGRLELDRALRDARDDGSRRVEERYHAAIAVADRAATSAGAATSVGAATSAGAPTSAGARIRVALPHDEPQLATGKSVRAPPEVLEASRWWVETVKIAPRRGFSKVKERDAFRCQNPECGRVALRVEAHHVHARAAGGADTDDNGVTVCRTCHLRGLHGSRLSVERLELDAGPALLWRWPDGRSVLALLGAPS